MSENISDVLENPKNEQNTEKPNENAEKPDFVPDTYRYPIIASSAAVLSTIGLLAGLLVGAYFLVLHYAYFSGNYGLIGGSSADDLQTIYGNVRKFEGIEAIISLFFIFLSLVGFFLAGVVKRLYSWLFLLVYSVFAFTAFIGVIAKSSIMKSLPLFVFVLVNMFIIFVLIPVLLSVKSFAGNGVPNWKRVLPPFVAVLSSGILLVLGFIMKGAQDYEFGVLYQIAGFFPQFFSFAASAFILLNLTTVISSFGLKRS